MILNDIQYNSSKKALTKFRNAFRLTKSESKSEKWLKDVELSGLKYQISKIQDEITHYEKLISGKVKFKSQYSIENLKTVLPEIRISSGLSQEDVAKKANIDLYRFRQLEDSLFFGSHRSTILKIAKVLNIGIVNQNSKERRTNLQKKTETDYQHIQSPMISIKNTQNKVSRSIKIPTMAASSTGATRYARKVAVK